MKSSLRILAAIVLSTSVLTFVQGCVSRPNTTAKVSAKPVQISESQETFTLSNGIVSAVISKRNGDIVSFIHEGTETITRRSGAHSGGYWSHDATGGVDLIPRISISPNSNGGRLAEVSVKGISGGRKMGHGPGTPVDGDLALDIDIRWAMKAGDAGIYTYTALDHPAEYPAGEMAEARIAVELAPIFDHIHADDARSGRYPLLNEGIDKYAYTALQSEERAFGWTSPEEGIGWFLLNPSAEYLSGGPTKAEFLVHGVTPTVLNYWKSSHYYGANVSVSEGEDWQRVIGPFKFQIVEGQTHSGMVAAAKQALAQEEADWPFSWVDADGYTPPDARGRVTGKLRLSGEYATQLWPGRLTVGLTRTPYRFTTDFGAEREIEWQNDGKYYQFWSRNSDGDGSFVIEDVPPGRYTLHAYADGIPGEFAMAEIQVSGDGQTNALGDLNWQPQSFGETIWQIGIPDRSGKEFSFGERYFEPGIQLQIDDAYPSGVQYDVATAGPQDWPFAQSPRTIAGQDYEVRAFVGVTGEGAENARSISFKLDTPPTGFATLRLGLTSVTSPRLEVKVNGKSVAPMTFELADHALVRHQMYGRWFENWTSFDAGLLTEGKNTITLTVPAGPINNSVLYDFVRLEIDGNAASAPPSPEPKPRRPLRPVPSPPSVEAYDIRTFNDLHRFELLPEGAPELTVRNGELVLSGTGQSGLVIESAGSDPGPWAVSPNGAILAYTLGDDVREGFETIKFFDLRSSQPLDDELLYVQNSSIAWSANSRGIYYSKRHDPYEDEERQRFNTAQSVHYHALGTDRLVDERVYGSDRGGMVHKADTSDDGNWLIVNASVGGNGRSEVILLNLNEPTPAPFKAIRTMSDSWQFAGSEGDMLYFVTSANARNRRLVRMDTSQPSLPITEVVGETHRILEMARIVEGQALLAYRSDETIDVETFELSK